MFNQKQISVFRKIESPEFILEALLGLFILQSMRKKLQEKSNKKLFFWCHGIRIIVCPLFCLSHLLLPPFAILVLSSVHSIIDHYFPPYAKFAFSCLLSMDSSINVENLRAKTLCFKSAFSQTCNRLERYLAQKIVSNKLWKLAELTDEAVDWFCKFKTAMEILAAAVPSKDIALFAISMPMLPAWSAFWMMSQPSPGPSRTASVMPMMTTWCPSWTVLPPSWRP